MLVKLAPAAMSPAADRMCVMLRRALRRRRDLLLLSCYVQVHQSPTGRRRDLHRPATKRPDMGAGSYRDETGADRTAAAGARKVCVAGCGQSPVCPCLCASCPEVMPRGRVAAILGSATDFFSKKLAGPLMP
jgi:hypothetical protein